MTWKLFSRILLTTSPLDRARAREKDAARIYGSIYTICRQKGGRMKNRHPLLHSLFFPSRTTKYVRTRMYVVRSEGSGYEDFQGL